MQLKLIPLKFGTHPKICIPNVAGANATSRMSSFNDSHPTYLFRVFLISAIATDRLDLCSILQLIPKHFLHAHRWIRTVNGKFITFAELRAQLLRSVEHAVGGRYGASIAFYRFGNICNWKAQQCKPNVSKNWTNCNKESFFETWIEILGSRL